VTGVASNGAAKMSDWQRRDRNCRSKLGPAVGHTAIRDKDGMRTVLRTILVLRRVVPMTRRIRSAAKIGGTGYDALATRGQDDGCEKGDL
jgi:hypothetical protein